MCDMTFSYYSIILWKRSGNNTLICLYMKRKWSALREWWVYVSFKINCVFVCFACAEGMFLVKWSEHSPGAQVLLFELVRLDEPLPDAHKVLVHEAPGNNREERISSKRVALTSTWWWVPNCFSGESQGVGGLKPLGPETLLEYTAIHEKKSVCVCLPFQ